MIDNIQKFKKALKRDIEKSLKLGAEIITANIRRETPVLTGTLKASIEPKNIINKIGKKSISVETNVEYAPAVELGRPDQPNRIARNMFFIGGENSKNQVEQIFKKNLPTSNNDL